MEQTTLSVAERHYMNHRKSVKEWQKRNPDKVRNQSLSYQHKMKKEEPEKYLAMLAKKKDYYVTVVKVKN